MKNQYGKRNINGSSNRRNEINGESGGNEKSAKWRRQRRVISGIVVTPPALFARSSAQAALSASATAARAASNGASNEKML